MAPLTEMRPKNSQSRIINEKEKQSKVSKLINEKITIVLSIVFDKYTYVLQEKMQLWVRFWVDGYLEQRLEHVA